MFKGHLSRLSDPEVLQQTEIEKDTNDFMCEIESMDPYATTKKSTRRSIHRKTALLEQVLDK